MPTYATNKRARFDYEIIDTMEAGLALSGQEVKAIRHGQAKLIGSFVTFHDHEAILTNAHISPYKFARQPAGYDSTHGRKLLLKKKEIDYLRGKAQEQGLTIIPLSLYTKGRYVKAEIGIAKGKKKYDKRETIKKRETEREVQRKMKSNE